MQTTFFLNVLSIHFLPTIFDGATVRCSHWPYLSLSIIVLPEGVPALLQQTLVLMTLWVRPPHAHFSHRGGKIERVVFGIFCILLFVKFNLNRLNICATRVDSREVYSKLKLRSSKWPHLWFLKNVANSGSHTCESATWRCDKHAFRVLLFSC